ncbi:MAG: DUF3080 family protein [Pseudomonadales bacterium]
MSDYLQRLSRVLEMELPSGRNDALAKMPARRELQLKLTQPKIDLLEFLRLADCHLQRLVAARNSSLGKLAQPSQRLIYELEFLQHGASCAALLRTKGRDDLAQKLNDVLREKRKQLPAVIWRATLGGSEMRTFWQVPNALGDYPAATASAVPTAMARLLRRVERWLGGDWQVSGVALERDLQLLKSSDGGALLRAWKLLEQGLGRGTVLLQNRLTERPLCFNGQPSRRARILFNVVQQKFIAELQPWAVDLNRRRYELLPTITQLEQTLATAEPASYRRWRRQRDERFNAAFAAPRQHVAALQPLFEQCGLAPGEAR